MFDDLFDRLMMIVMLTVFGGFALFLLVAAFDGVQAARARHAKFACEQQNLEPKRKLFSTEVACRARNLGSDTLNIRNLEK